MYRAQFFDGVTSRRYAVTLAVENDAIVIRSADDGVDFEHYWLFAELVPVPTIRTDQPFRLRCRSFGDARLVIGDGDALAMLRTHLPTRWFIKPDMKSLFGLAAGLAALTAGVLLLVYISIPLLARPIAAMIPLRLEQQLGQGIYVELTQDWPPCLDNKSAHETLNDLWRSLNVAQGMMTIAPKVIVVNTDLRNAFALPGGYILITNGLLQSLETPDELAGVLAHEMGHTANRHSMVSLVERQGILFAINLISGGSSSDIILTAGRHLTHLSYSRELEREADHYALTLLKNAQISTKGYSHFFARLAAEDGRTSNRAFQSMFSSHPLSAERAETARLVRVSNPRPALSDAQWRDVRAICTGKGK